MKGSHISNSKSQNWERISKKSVQIFLAVSTILLISHFSFLISTADAAPGINKTINFQGKLVGSDGTNVSDNTYSVVFTLYDAASNGNNLWTETQSVTTVDGVFQVSLGSVNTTLGNVDFNSDRLYLGIKVGADSEMTPRIRFASVPYAFNAGRLNGVTATQSANSFTLTGGTSTQKTLGINNSLTFAGTDGTVITFQGTDTYVGLSTIDILTNKTIGSTGLTFSGATTDITTATDEDFTIAPNGSGDTIFRSDADTAFLIGSSANTPAVLSISGGIGNNAAFIVNNTNSGNLFVASASGTTKFVVSNTGAITSANYTTNTGVLYTDSNGLFQQTSGGSNGNCLVMSGTTPTWGSCVTGGGQDLSQSTSSLNNTTLAGTATLIGTVSITPTSATGDVWVQAYLWTNSLSNTNQTVTWELRSGTNCSGSVLTSQTSALTSANASDGPSGFLSYVTTNPGASQQDYAVCGSSTVASGVSAGGMATATVLDNTGPQGIQGIQGQSNWQITSLGVIAPSNLTTDLLLGSTATATARFAVINVNSGTTTASISAGAAGGIYMTAAGTITTTANQSLILGNSTSGHVILNPLNRMYVGIGTTSPVATLDVRGNTGLSGGTVPVASLSGRTSFSSLVVNNMGAGDIFTASSSGVPHFTIQNNGAIVSSHYTINGGLLYGTSTGLFTQLADVAAGSCLNSGGVGAVPTWGACGTNYWQVNNGTISPFSATADVLIGGIATNAAKFAVINVNSGTPTATVAGNLVVSPYTNSQGAPLGGNLTVGGVQGFANAIANFGGSVNSYLQVNNQNRSTGPSASTDFIATNDIGTDSTNYIDFGINSSGYNDSAYSIGGANDAYLYNNGGNLSIGTQTGDKVIKFHAGGTTAANEIFRMSGIRTTATASVAASTTFAGMVVDNSGRGDIFSASSSGVSQFVIRNGGQVGIGTTMPTQKLDVNGNLRVRNLTNNNGVLYADNTGLVQQTSTGGAGTLCLTSTDGGTPVFGSCAGTASTVWSSLSSPSQNLSLSMTTRTSTFNWATGTSTNNLFSLTTDNSANGTGALLNLATGNSSTVAPLNVSAAGRQVLYVTSAGTIGVGTTTVGNGMLVVNQQNGTGDIFAASQSGNTKFVITNGGSVGVGTTTTLGTFDVRGNSGTAPAATVSANTTFAGLVINNSGSGDIFTASSAGTGRFTVKQNGVIQLGTSTYANCGALNTDASGNVVCGGATGDTATFSDTTPAAIADNDTTELFNDAGKPSVTPNSTTQTVLVAFSVRFTGTGNTDTDAVVRVVRNIGSAASCTTSTQVGDTFGAFVSNATDIQTAGGTFLDTPASTSQIFYTVCSSANSVLGNTPTVNRVDISLIELGADLAENYYTTDDSIQPGDIVTIDAGIPAGAKKSTKVYDEQVLGIVSTAPGKVLDDWIGRSFGRPIPVALSGRVPVKVSTENGEIKAGDYLTTSSIPGVAMKATKAGFVVGQAMTAYTNSGIGSVMAFVKTAWYDPEAYLLSAGGFQILSGSSAAGLSLENATAKPVYSVTDSLGQAVNRVGIFSEAAVGNIRIGYAEAQSMTIDGYLNVKENITAGILTAGEITTNSLIITSDNISIGSQTLRDYIASVVVDVLKKQNVTQEESITTVSGLLTQSSGEQLFKKLLAENVLGASSSAVLAQAPDTSVVEAPLHAEGELTLKSLDVDGLATVSSTLRVKQNGLVEGMLTVIDTLMTKNLIVSGLATFVDDVIFKGSVSFAKPPTFSKDTAGFAIIKKDSDRVEVVFDTAYDQIPVVNASLSLNEVETTPKDTEKTKDEIQEELEQAVLGSDISYIVTKRTTKGFTILLNKPADNDVSFSWTAITVSDPETFESKPKVIFSPTPTISEPSPRPAGGNPDREEVTVHEGIN